MFFFTARRYAMRKRVTSRRPVSVCHTHVLYRNSLSCHQTFLRRGSPIILVFFQPGRCYNLQNSNGNPLSGNGKKLRFSTEIAVNLGNGMR